MPDPVIETRGLLRRFGDHVAVDHIDLNVPARSIYGFLGPNGAGKSTTIRLLLGLLRADAGQIRLFGRPLHEHRHALLRRTGTLLEAPSIYEHLSGRENLEVTCRLRGMQATRINRVLDVVELAADADRRAGAYSMGMKQRLGLALALLGTPELLVLDEPTSGLDPAGMKDVRALIRRLPERTGATVFLSSHLLGEVERTATHVGVLRAGRLVFQGEAEALAERKEHRIVLGTSRPVEAVHCLRAAGIEPRAGGERGGRVTVPLERGTRSRKTAARCTALLVEAGFDVHHVAVEESSLESTFLKLTRPEEKPAFAE